MDLASSLGTTCALSKLLVVVPINNIGSCEMVLWVVAGGWESMDLSYVSFRKVLTCLISNHVLFFSLTRTVDPSDPDADVCIYLECSITESICGTQCYSGNQVCRTLKKEKFDEAGCVCVCVSYSNIQN